MTDHRAVLARRDILGELLQLCFVFETVCTHAFDSLDGIIFGRLLLESHGEDVILNGLEQFCKHGHSHGDFLLVVVRAIHSLQNVLRDIQRVPIGILNCDSITFDRLDLQVSALGEELFHLKLLRVP